MLTAFAALAVFLPAADWPDAAPPTVDPALPRVLLIGDSISMGYTDPLRKELAGEANVFRIPTNGGPTTRGVELLDEWLGEETWDVIHVNWGLHDLKYMDAAGKLVPVEQGTQQVPPEEYRKNLATLFDRLEKTGARVIWASTTPVPQGSHGRIGGEALKYNAIAAEVLKGRDVQVNDLHAVASADLAKWQKPRNVHFTDEGSNVLAKAVAQTVRKALKDAAQPAPAR